MSKPDTEEKFGLPGAFVTRATTFPCSLPPVAFPAPPVLYLPLNDISEKPPPLVFAVTKAIELGGNFASP